METIKRIKLSGSLGRRFGVFHELAVESYPEAIRAALWNWHAHIQSCHLLPQCAM